MALEINISYKSSLGKAAVLSAQKFISKILYCFMHTNALLLMILYLLWYHLLPLYALEKLYEVFC